MSTRPPRPARHPLPTAALSCIVLLVSLPLGSPLHAQADASSRLAAAVAGLEWRELGPTIMGGRISDLAAVESDPSTFYVGTATGGVWKTVNGGTTFEPVFTDQETASIGDVTLAPSNPNVVWVGTGEPQNRQSSPWGNGVYRSTDGGRTWTHLGLENTHHIARIRVDPRDPDVAYAAAVGHLWGPNPERGVYRTTDGGETWERVLFVDEDTGAIDLVMDPNDPRTLFAATYQRRRTAWGFNGGGPGSGIWRTTDGGDTWEELTEGLPEGDKGRIGLDIYRGDGNLVFAIVEADARAPGQGFGGGDDDRERRNGVYRSTDRGLTWEHLSTTNNRPMYYSQIRVDPNDPERIYLGGSDLYRSSDGGRTFDDDAADDVHPDHHALWIDPNDSEHMILGSDGGVSVTWDRGESWRQLRNLPIAQFYEIGVDLRQPYHVCGGLQDNGSWCAPSDTWSDQGIRPRDWYNVGSGDGFFTVLHPDGELMFAESQGGNLARYHFGTRERTRMRPLERPAPGASEEEEEENEYRWNWDTPVLLSSHDPSTLYIGSNVLHRSTDLGWTWEVASPDLTHEVDRDTLEIMGVPGAEPQMSVNDGQASYGNLTAIAESPVDAGVLWTGSDDGLVHVTRDGAGTWTDVTPNIPGLPPRTYVTRIVASHADPGTAYAAFDGHRNDDFRPHVYVTADYGASWRPIVDGLPESPVNALAQHPRTHGLLFAGNELGVWFTTDGGARWVPLGGGNLPTVPVDDIEIHPRENDLVIGTHGRGIWILPDIGPLERLGSEVLAADAHLFPVRPAISYNPYEPQGWSPGIWAAENPPVGALIRYHLREPLATADRRDVAAAEQGEAAGRTGAAAGRGNGVTESGTASGEADDAAGQEGGDGPEGSGAVAITILDAGGTVVRELEGPGDAGIQQVVWDLRMEPPYESEGGGGFFGSPEGPKVLPGAYTVRLEAAGTTLETPVEVRLDPRVEISREDLLARQDAMRRAYRLEKPVHDAEEALERLTERLGEIRALLREHEDAPEDLVEEVETLREDVGALEDELDDADVAGRAARAVESSTTRPTADQLWQIERAWDEIPPLIERLNAILETRMPALYERLEEHDVRPDLGEPVEVPSRPGS